MGVALWAVGVSLAGFGVRTEREPLPAREVERGVVIPKGWTEATVEGSVSRTERSFTSGGGSAELPATWDRQGVAVTARYGLAPGWEIRGSMPWIRSRARGVQTGFGSAQIATRVSLLHREAPLRSLAVEVGGRFPLGFDGGALDGERIPLTTGTSDAWLGLRGHQKWGGMRIDLGVAGVARFAGRPTWAAQRFRPGHRVEADTTVLLQGGPLVLGPHARLTVSDAVHTTRRIEGSGGVAAWVGGVAMLQFTRGVALVGRWTWTVAGPDDRFVFLDEVHPAKSRRRSLAIRGSW